MIDEETSFTSPPPKKIGAALMTDKPTTNIIEMGTQAEFEPVSPLSGDNTPTPMKNLFSPRPDGTKRPINESKSVQAHT